MSQNLNEAVGLLNDLLALGRTTTSVVDQTRLDATVAVLGPIALEDVERWTTRLAEEAQATADRIVANEAAAAQAVIDEEDAATAAATQEELDQAEREERSRLGVS